MPASPPGWIDLSDPPVVYPRSFQQRLLRSCRGRSFGQRFKPWLGLRPRDLKPVLPAVVEPRTGLSMGQSCELMVKTWSITREEQDQLAYESHVKAAAAWHEGFYDDLVVPYRRPEDRQQRARRHLGGETRQAQAGIRPQRQRHAYRRQQHSADRRCGRAAAGLGGMGAEHKLPVLAYLRAGKTWAVDFASGKEGLLMAPAYAVAAILRDTGLTLQDFDYYEIHEAFAAVPLCLFKAWESADYCRERLGWPGAAGRDRHARSSTSKAAASPSGIHSPPPARAFSRCWQNCWRATHNPSAALASACTAGGMGVTAILERA